MRRNRRSLRPPRLDYRDAVLLIIAGFFAVGVARAEVLNDLSAGALRLDDGRLAPPPATRVQIDISGMVAEIRLEQAFHNPSAEVRDGTYAFPLPENAAVHRMVLEVDGRRIEGEILEKEQARREFEQARQSGQRASLVSQQRPNLFTTQVANIPPGAAVRVTLSYAQVIDYRSGRFSLRFPMAITARYGDAVVSAATAGPGGHVDLSLELEPGFDLVRLESSYHEASIDRRNDRYQLKMETWHPDRDFELVWEPSLSTTPQAAVLTQRYDGETYGLLMLLPPQPEYRSVQPRELILIVDTSGSMSGASMEQARESLLMAIGSLGEIDRFNIIEFNSTASALFHQPVDASGRNIGRAVAWIEQLSAGGGTEMAPALKLALAGQPPIGFLRQVVFITDGAVGNEAALFAQIASDLGEARLFTVGIGNAPNSYFMRKAAEFGRGSYSYVGKVEEVAEKMDLLLSRLEHPAMTEVCAHWGEGAETYPQQLPDLYIGEPLLITSRMDPMARSLEVCGNTEARQWKQQLALAPPRDGFAISTLWARRKIDGLMDELIIGADPQTIRQDVVAVALRHKLVSAYTSFVAMDRTPRIRQSSDARMATVPLPQTDAGSIMKISFGLFVLMIAWVLRRRLGDES